MVGHLSCLQWRLGKGIYLVAIGGGCTLELGMITSCDGKGRQNGRKKETCNFNYIQLTTLISWCIDIPYSRCAFVCVDGRIGMISLDWSFGNL